MVMGYGEWLANESVHWTIVHEDETGVPVALASRQGQGHHPKAGHDVNVDRTCRGCDPVALKHVGQRKGHAGHYRVTLRFERRQDAEKAAASVRRMEAREGMYELVLDVPVVYRKHPADAPPAEIRIDW
jgi:hypothetical protein